MRYHRHFRRKPFDVLRLFLQKTLRDEQREVRVARPGLLDSLVELVAQGLPDGETVGPKHDTSAHRRVVGQFGAKDQIVVPGGEVLAARGDFFLVGLFAHSRGLFQVRFAQVRFAIALKLYTRASRDASLLDAPSSAG